MFKRPKWLIILLNVRHNLSARWRLFRGEVESDVGATHFRLSTEASVEYINRVFYDYMHFGALTPEDLEGITILELGPGDNLGVALRFYAAGAARVVCLDKFFAKRDATQQAAIYRSLRETLSPQERARYDLAISLDDGIAVDNTCVHYIPGAAAEDANELLGRASVDLVISRAVIWEIDDTDRVFRALDWVLRPGGLMIHKIACLDWMSRQSGYHPLEFLTVSDRVYRWMARDSGKSNRRTIDYYREVMAGLGYEALFHITRVVGSKGPEFPPGTVKLLRNVHYSEDTLALIREIRPRLLPRFQSLSDEDLMVEDMFVVGTKSSAEVGREDKEGKAENNAYA